jgi:hypothetical protein
MTDDTLPRSVRYHCELRYDVAHDGTPSGHACSYWLEVGTELQRDGRWCCSNCARVWDAGGPKR